MQTDIKPPLSDNYWYWLIFGLFLFLNVVWLKYSDKN